MTWTWKSWLGMLGILAFLGAMLAWRTINQDSVLADFRNALSSDAGYLMLCDARGAVSSNSCQVIDESTNFKLSAALKHLSQARANFMPGKGSTSSERILKLGRDSPASKQYLACYRLLHYAGFSEIYINPVLMDPECTHIERFLAGDLAVPVHSWVGLPTAKSP